MEINVLKKYSGPCRLIRPGVDDLILHEKQACDDIRYFLEGDKWNDANAYCHHVFGVTGHLRSFGTIKQDGD